VNVDAHHLLVTRRGSVQRRLVAAFTVVCVSFGVTACGGSNRLSRDAYRSRLAKIAKEADVAHGDVDKAMGAKTVAAIRTRLKAFAAAEDQLGDEVAALKPPKDAAAANAELARGEHDLASEIRAMLPQVQNLTTPKAALSLLDKQLGNVKGGNEEDDALSKLKKLGYTKGS
jgi:hypothetical protein